MDDRGDDYLRPYRDAVQRHGASFEATLWGSERAQRLRFQVMSDLAGGFADCVILDVGCGRGDLAAYLVERSTAFSLVIGIDAMPEMIDDARARALPRTRFEVGDALTGEVIERAVARAERPVDWACISGAMNTMDDDTARALVERVYAIAQQGVVFNFLSDRPHERWAGRDLAPARRFDTVAWIDWALSRTTLVDFSQSYLDGHDATILIRHEA